MIFENLAPGRYKAYPQTDKYVTSPVELVVKPGQTASATARLSAGQRVIFRLKEDPQDPLSGLPWVGYKITKVDGKTPVREDSGGPLTGELLHLSGGAPRQAGFRIEPGTYKLTAVLRRETSRNSINAQDDLWKMEQTLKVVPGKDIVIEMPVKSP